MKKDRVVRLIGAIILPAILLMSCLRPSCEQPFAVEIPAGEMAEAECEIICLSGGTQYL